MLISKAPIIYSQPTDLVAPGGGAFVKQTLANLAGVSSTFSGSLNLLMSNVGANGALFFLSVDTGNAPAVNGMILGASPANPIIVPDLHPTTVLWFKSTAGTTIEIQVGKTTG